MNRAALVALLLAVMPAMVSAHALPGTVLTIASDDDSLDLTVQVPLHDLSLVLPAMPDALPPGEVDRDLWPVLTPYFDAHLGVAPLGQADVPLALTAAVVQATWDEHLGDYDLIVLTFSAQGVGHAKLYPLTLRYDAVIHEIRNQAVMVMVKPTGKEAVGVGWIGVDLASGLANDVVIAVAP